MFHAFCAWCICFCRSSAARAMNDSSVLRYHRLNKFHQEPISSGHNDQTYYGVGAVFKPLLVDYRGLYWAVSVLEIMTMNHNSSTGNSPINRKSMEILLTKQTFFQFHRVTLLQANQSSWFILLPWAVLGSGMPNGCRVHMLQSGVRISMLYHVVPAVKEPAVTEPAA